MMREPCPKVATDVIIEYVTQEKNGVVLIDRKYSPLGIALVGGFAIEGLSYEDNARKEASEETSLDVRLYNPEVPLCVKSHPERDPRGHITSLTYIGRGEGILAAQDDAKDYLHVTHEELARLLTQRDRFAFADHIDILERYLEKRSWIIEDLPASPEDHHNYLCAAWSR